MYINKGQREYNGIVEPRDRVAGIEVSGTLPFNDWGFWAETAHYLDTDKYEYVVGTDYYFGEIHTTFEYYKNGFGSGDKSAYDTTLIAQGRLLAQDYFVPSVDYIISEKLTLMAFNFWNLNDGGMVLGGVIDYFYDDNVELILMPVFFTGSDDSEAGQQSAAAGNYAVECMVKCVF